MELSQGMESAAKNVKELTSQPADSSNGSESSIHKVTASLPQGRCCYRCGKPGHYATTCKFRDAKCHKCGKVGHLQKVCQSKIKKQQPEKQSKKPVHAVDKRTDQPASEEPDSMYNIHTCNVKATPWNVEVNINNTPVKMQVNTGASFSIMSETIFREHWPNQVLASTQVKLCSYTGESI